MKIKTLISNPAHIFFYLKKKGLLEGLSDENYLRFMYKAYIGDKLNLLNPQGFNEKLQWLKLYNRKEEYCNMVDKCEAKKYVQNLLGEGIGIIPTLGVWDNFDDIDFDALPDQFVLKCTHDSGGLVICKDKSKLDLNIAREKIERSLKTNFFYFGREWVYKNVEPRIIAEKYLYDSKKEIIDNWKFYCSYGNVFAFYVTTGGGHSINLEMTYFDGNNNVLPVKNVLYPNCSTEVVFPDKLDEMKRYASILSEDKPFVRVDFYYVNDTIYFGELTFYPGGGFEKIIPNEYDLKWGQCISLPKK